MLKKRCARFGWIFCAVHLQACETPSSQALNPDDPFYSMGHKTVLVGELPYSVQVKVHEVEARRYKELREIAQEAAFDALVQMEAKKLLISPEAARAKMLEVGEATDEEMEAYYDTVADKIRRPFNSAKEELKIHLRNEKMQDKKRQLVANFQKEQGANFVLREPVPPRTNFDTSHYPQIVDKPNNSSEGPAIEVVEFLDYHCPFCREAEPDVRKLANELGRPVRIVAIDLPHAEDDVADALARGAWCAKKFGRYEVFRPAAFQFYGTKKGVTEEFPTKLQLDAKEWSSCLRSQDVTSYLKLARTQASLLGVTGTPTFFIERRRFQKELSAKAILGFAR